VLINRDSTRGQVKKCQVFVREQRHIGLNIAIVPEALLNEFQQIAQSEPVYLEITPATRGSVGYGYAWHEGNANFDDCEGALWVIGLEQTLMDTCLVDPGDIVEVRPLKPQEIKNAINIELQPIGESASKIQTEEDLQTIKNRILGGEVILGQESRFTVPLLVAGISNQIAFCVLSTQPENCPVRCNDKTTVEFKGVSTKAKKSAVSFADVGGLKKQISSLREMIQLPLEYPEVFAKLGINPPRGILLYGPPGNGKTLLVRATASEINAHFYAINGPELTSKFVGEGERKLREVFEKARVNAPSIIFFDEIDSFAGKRDFFTAEYDVKMVGQLLSLMDGLADRGNVIVIAATNRPNSIDPALRRPGRFDREIEVGLPNESDRLEILEKYVIKMDVATDINLESWAKKTSGYVGADLAALARESAIRCLRRAFELSPEGKYIKRGDVCITNEDFYEAFKELQPTTLRDLPIQGKSLSWEELLGVNSIKERLLELVETSLLNPVKLKETGLTPPSGILLVGSQQSGKKSLAIALANKLGIQCISVKALEAREGDVRKLGPNLAEIFRKARLSSPSLILIDKIDLAFSPQLKTTSESFLFAEELADEIRRNRLYEGVFAIATVRNIENLPPTLLDPSVFGHILHIPLPSLNDCEAIIRAKIADYFESEVNYQDLAKAVEGLNVGEIVYACQESLRMSLKSGNLNAIIFQNAAQIVKDTKTSVGC
jgi:transitional endoplasmic reticulum ATPase